MSYNSFQSVKGLIAAVGTMPFKALQGGRGSWVLGSTGGDVPTDHLILGSSLWLGQVETVLEVGSPVQTPLC